MADNAICLVRTEGADAAVAESVLRALPDWFGIEEALIGYVRAASIMTTVTAWAGERPVGFAALEEATTATREIRVIGVLPDQHGQGVGTLLVEALEDRARADGAAFLTVKTLSSHYPDPFYDRTRHFYETVGFLPLAELPEH